MASSAVTLCGQNDPDHAALLCEDVQLPQQPVSVDLEFMFSFCCMLWLQVVLSYGAESDRRLNIPGEVRSGCGSAESTCRTGTLHACVNSMLRLACLV